MIEKPKTPHNALSQKRIQVIFSATVLIIALLWGIVKGSHRKENITGNTIKFSNYNTDLLLEEQNAYHNDIKKRMEINNSNLQSEIECQEKTNETLSRQLQTLEKLPPKVTIIKDKRENKNEKNDTLNTPSAY